MLVLNLCFKILERYCAMARWIEDLELRGKYVMLVPTTFSNAVNLTEAVKDGELWKLWYTSVPSPDNMISEIKRRIKLYEQGLMHPFTVINLRSNGEDRSNNLAGMTTYCNLDEANRRLEIGYTWYRKSLQQTILNTEAKYLLLKHAFEVLGCIKVEFRTSSFNFASRRAIERLGAKLDGVLRNHRILENGAIGDGYVYSILNSEWPIVKTHLEHKLKSYEE